MNSSATSSIQPFIHQTPDEAVEQVVEQEILLGARTFHICYPGNADALLDHPETHAAFQKDEYMPYWADLWPSAQMLGQALLDAASLENRSGLRGLEVGCGVGLPGIVALSLGIQMVFSDYDRAALAFARRNALANGIDETQFELLPLDWRSPPPSLKVDLLLASDVIYERRNIQPLIALIQSLLLPGGQCWLVDPNRPFQSDFEAALGAAALSFDKTTRSTWLGSEAEAQSVQGTLFKISQSV